MSPLFSTAYFPPIDYMAALLRCKEVVIEVCETYPKRTYRNRTYIATASGKLPLIVPITKPYGNHTMTKDVRIANHERWNVVHLRTITAAYSSSPYFVYYKDELESLLMGEYLYLVDLNKALVLWVLKCMNVSCSMKYSTQFAPIEQKNEDFRLCFSPKQSSADKDMPVYYQVFRDRNPFIPNLSILDLLMNLGPDALGYLKSINVHN